MLAVIIFEVQSEAASVPGTTILPGDSNMTTTVTTQATGETTATTTTTTTTTMGDTSGAGDVDISNMTLYASSNFSSDATDATEVFLKMPDGTNANRVKFNHGTGKSLIGESSGNKYLQVVREVESKILSSGRV